MTDYGPGPGYEPWPEDPLYGDLGGQRGPAAPVATGWDPHAPYDPYATGQQYLPGWDNRQNPQEPYPQGQFAPQQYPPQEFPPQQYPPQQYPPQQGQPPQAYAPQQYPQQPYPGQQGHPPQQGRPGPAGPYPGQGPAGPYPGQGNQPYYGQNGGWGEAEQTAEWQQVPAGPQAAAGEEFGREDGGRDAFESHPFFDDPDDADGSGRDTDAGPGTDEDGHDDGHEGHGAPEDDEYADDEYDEDDRRRLKKRRGNTKKRRSGSACLVMTLLFTGVAGGGGYVGYQYWQNHFAAPPDFPGQGTGTVEVQIPDGATLAVMGNILKKAGVVESVDAFTAAAAKSGANLQGGTYELHLRMSAAAAVALMMDPTSQNALVIPEGFRAGQIYARLDQRLGLSSGTTQAAARSADLGLPSYANGNPEGFLFPSRYSLSKSGKPADILARMVRQAQAEYAKDDLVARARQIGMTPYQVIIIASLIQAEAQQPQDFGKVSRVIYNRLSQNMALGFDSTINYALGRSTLHTTTADTRLNSPYNTYLHKGLPPGPIDNPGHEAIEAALNPEAGNWLYFVTVKPGDTRFTASAAEHERNVQAFNQYQRTHGGS